MSVKIEGLAETVQALYAKSKSIESAVDVEVRKGAYRVERDAKISMSQGTHTGKTYKRGSKTHTASAPGEAPAVDSSVLILSIATMKALYGNDWLVGTSVGHGRDTEFGTKNMAARPWLIPALEKNRNDIENNIKKAMRGET